uniref:Uncharacterized protein n=1 Tax=Sus scrofa TaxID=9823 RepID=A0A8D1VDS7_PIG
FISMRMRCFMDVIMYSSRHGNAEREKLCYTCDKTAQSHVLNIKKHDYLRASVMDFQTFAKIHSLGGEKKTCTASKSQDMFYELDPKGHTNVFLEKCKSKTQLKDKRKQQQQQQIFPGVPTAAQQVHEFNRNIPKSLSKVIQLGGGGCIHSLQKFPGNVHGKKKKKKRMEKVEIHTVPDRTSWGQQLRSCSMCTAYLNYYDNASRRAHHFAREIGHLNDVTSRNKSQELKRLSLEKTEEKTQQHTNKRKARVRKRGEKLRHS